MIRRPPRSTRTDTLFPTRRSSDLDGARQDRRDRRRERRSAAPDRGGQAGRRLVSVVFQPSSIPVRVERSRDTHRRSEEHTSELQSLMRISYAVFCLKKKKKKINKNINYNSRKKYNINKRQT